MKEKGKEPNTLGLIRRGLAYHDKAAEIFEQVEGQIVRAGIPAEFIPIRSRRQRDQVCRFHVSIDADETATVKVDDKDPFRLPPTLGQLARILATENGDTDPEDNDPFVPFKSVEEILACMKTSLRKEYAEGALKQAIHRLRKVLALHDYGEVLQRNHRTGAYRMRLHRKKFCALAGGLSTSGTGLGGSGQQPATAGKESRCNFRALS